MYVSDEHASPITTSVRVHPDITAEELVAELRDVLQPPLASCR